VRYVRDNFVYGREFLGDGDLNAQALLWMDHTANPRVLQPLLAGRYTPLVLSPHRLTRPELAAGSARARHPVVEVERRPLAAYAQLAGAEAEA